MVIRWITAGLKTRPTVSVIAGCVIFAAIVSGQARQTQIDPCANARDLHLTNGKIATMDRGNTTVSEVTIQNGRFTAVGPRGGQRLSPCTREINLRGRTVVPGLIDKHNHIVLLGIRPGYHTPLEGTASIAEVQAVFKARAKGVPAGGFITSMGGWNPAQFAEKRLPTLAELDAADADHPVFMFLSFTGP
ncbi:MAG TPA: amidohydrolase family protein, partial [Vicinamibacterales bacterium]